MKQKVGTVLLLLALVVGGCYPAGPNYTEDLDLVFTSFNQNYSFSGKNTYAMPDSIVLISGSLIKGDTPKFMNDTFAQPILAQVAKNMEAHGYTRVDISAGPKLLLAPASLQSTTYYYDWWYYWGYWWGGYYPPWGGWYYPPSYPVVYSYSSGTLVLTITDPNDLGPGGTSPMAWTALGNGILTGNLSASRVNSLIDQMFTQSPYLKP
jgi:Domain of unknown function (DUF4136)